MWKHQQEVLSFIGEEQQRRSDVKETTWKKTAFLFKLTVTKRRAADWWAWHDCCGNVHYAELTMWAIILQVIPHACYSLYHAFIYTNYYLRLFKYFFYFALLVVCQAYLLFRAGHCSCRYNTASQLLAMDCVIESYCTNSSIPATPCMSHLHRPWMAAFNWELIVHTMFELLQASSESHQSRKSGLDMKRKTPWWILNRSGEMSICSITCAFTDPLFCLGLFHMYVTVKFKQWKNTYLCPERFESLFCA